MIRIENLHKNFKENIVLNDIDLKVKPNKKNTAIIRNLTTMSSFDLQCSRWLV